MATEAAALAARIVDALALTLLDGLWQSLLIVALYAAARAIVRGARLRVLLGHVALLALALAPLAGFVAHFDAASPAPTASLLAAASYTLADSDAGAEASLLDAWLQWMVLAWALGVSVLSARLLREWWNLRGLCRAAMPLPADWQHRFAGLAQRLQVRVRVRVALCEQTAVPLLIGVLRPVVLMPAGLFARLPADQVELILLHELAHLRRFDPWFNLLQAAVETLLFHHPAVHWLARRLRQDRELCCDDVVLEHGGERLRYARVLLALAEALPRSRSSLALAASGGLLMERVERIVGVAPRTRRARVVPPLLLAAALVLAWSPLTLQRLIADAAVALQPLAIGVWPERQVVPLAQTRPRVTDMQGTRMPLPPAIWSETGSSAEAGRVTAAVAPSIATAPRVELLPSASASDSVPSASDPATFAASPLASPTSASASLAPVPLAPVEPALPEPERSVMPAYPRSARFDRIEGWARLAYRVDGDGRVRDVEVVESQPPGVFDAVSIRALQRWRFAPAASGTRRQHQFDFVLPRAVAGGGADGAERCNRRTGSRLCVPLDASQAQVRLSAD
jgi:bla regulator protein BlaR1